MKYNGVNIQKINNNSKNYTINNKQAYHWRYRNRFLFQVTFHFYFLLLLLFLNTHSPLLFIFSLCRIILPGTSIRNYTFPFFSSSWGSLLSFSFSLFFVSLPPIFFLRNWPPLGHGWVLWFARFTHLATFHFAHLV